MEKLESLAHDGKINEEASVKDKQSIIIHASVEQVWSKIINIDQWPTWNRQVTQTAISSAEEGALFKWTMNGEHFASKITLADQPTTFSFVSKSKMLKMVTLFHLDEVGDHQTAVIIEGSMQGLKTLFTHKHRRTHESFLQLLEDLRKSFEG